MHLNGLVLSVTMNLKIVKLEQKLMSFTPPLRVFLAQESSTIGYEVQLVLPWHPSRYESKRVQPTLSTHMVPPFKGEMQEVPADPALQEPETMTPIPAVASQRKAHNST